MIKLRNINKQYDRRILTNVNLDFLEGNIYVIKGVSGCGKTTLLNILGGIEQSYTGMFEYNDYVITSAVEKKLSRKDKKTNHLYRDHVGYIFQQSLLISHLSVMENLTFIHDDKDVIFKYAKLLGVADLLDKYPSELSNGERQRFSIIRALILNASIILADEPTASLDETTSKEVVSAFLKIKNDQKIIIIVTHDDCFDEVADYVWNLDYGTIQEEHTEVMIKKMNHVPKNGMKHYNKDIQYAKMKKKHNSKVFSFSMISMILVILTFLGLYFHLEQGMQNYVYEHYPYQTMIITNEQTVNINDQSNLLTRYENYYLTSDGYTFLPWITEEDSSLTIPNALFYGEYPSEENEIIITKFLAKQLYPEKELRKIIGEEYMFSFDTTPYKIVAILTDDMDVLRNLDRSYPIYKGVSEKKSCIFLSYNKISEFGAISPINEHLYSAGKTSAASLQFQESISKYSPWSDMVEGKIYGLKQVMNIFMICVPVILSLAFMFLLNMIYMDILYRKNEFGYLQIFHVGKRRIYHIVFLEYLYRILSPVIIAFLSYWILVYIVMKGMDLKIGLQIIELFFAFLFILVYLSLLVYFPLKKILKQSIMQMIND